MPQTSIARTMNAIIEGCWLLAIIITPAYFNIWTRRVFEPDKIVVMRDLVLIMVIALLVKFVTAIPSMVQRQRAQRSDSDGNGGSGVTTSAALRQHLRERPMLVPTAIFIAIYGLATLTSIDPYISFWGSYERLQGMYTWLNYIAIFVILIYHIKNWDQIERLLSAMIFTSLPVAYYGIIQHFNIDPLPWGGDVTTRVASSLGNPIFLGAYLLMIVPIVIYRLTMEWRGLIAAAQPAPIAENTRGGRKIAAGRATRAQLSQYEVRSLLLNSVAFVVGVNLVLLVIMMLLGPVWSPILAVILLIVLPEIQRMLGIMVSRMLLLYSMILVVDLLSTYFTVSRGPVFGLLAGLLVFAILVSIRFGLRWLTGVTVALAVAMAIVLVLANIKNPVLHAGSSGLSRLIGVTSTESGTTEVRTLIWKGSFQLIKKKPLLGYGPETMLLAYNPVYPPALGHIEAANASPDRNHDESMDFLVMSGVLGFLAYYAILGTFFWIALSLFRRRDLSFRDNLLVMAVISAVIGHMVEGLVGIAIVSTLLHLWVFFAIVSLLRLRLLAQSRTMPVTATATEPVAATLSSRATGGRRPVRPARTTAPLPTWDTLKGSNLGKGIGLAIVAGVLVVASFLVGAFNVTVVSADKLFKDALNIEDAANQYYTAGSQALTNSNSQTGQTQQSSRQQAQQNLQQAYTYFSAAINTYNQAKSQQPQQDFYDLFLGKTWLERVQTDNLMGNAGARDQDLKSGEAVLLQAHGINPLDSDHSANLARLYHLWANFDPSKWQLAIDWFNKTVELAPHNSVIINEAGTAQRDYAVYLQQHGQEKASQQYFQMAMATFKHAATIDPQSSDAEALLGDTAFVYVHDYKTAITAYSAAVHLGSSNVGAIYTNLSYAYNVIGQYTQAISTARASLAVQPNNLPVLNIMGSAYNSTSQYTGAISAAQTAISLAQANLRAQPTDSQSQQYYQQAVQLLQVAQQGQQKKNPVHPTTPSTGTVPSNTKTGSTITSSQLTSSHTITSGTGTKPVSPTR